jgi:hypothetical protein
MAKIVLGIGCTHTPQLHTPADKWDIRADRDRKDGVPLWYRGCRMNYAEVLEKRRHMDLEAQTTMDVREQRLRQSFAAIDVLREIFANARPDVAIIFGNDQGEMFLDDIKPAFTIMGCAEFENMPRSDEQIARLPPGIALSDAGHLPDCGREVFPGHPALATHIADHAIRSGFDIAYSARQPHADPSRAHAGGMPHAYGFIYKQIFRGSVVPSIVVDTNTFYPPNQPLAQRCLALGQIVGDAILDWDEDIRVCVIASGGLSHFVVDEEFDRDILQAMRNSNFAHLLTYSEGYYQAGSSEIKSWIVAGGAMHRAALDGHIVDYQPLYRTAAGTGSSAAFMVWQ